MKPHRIVILVAIALLLAPVLLLATSSRRSNCPGISCLSHPPLFEISWGANNRWIINRGFNFVWNKPLGPPGTYLEFPITLASRASLRLWTPRWGQESHEFNQ